MFTAPELLLITTSLLPPTSQNFFPTLCFPSHPPTGLASSFFQFPTKLATGSEVYLIQLIKLVSGEAGLVRLDLGG
jgi:hypothetical protein